MHLKSKLLEAAAGCLDQEPRLFDPKGRLSYQGLVDRAAAVALSVRREAQPVTPRHIGLFLPNSLDFLSALFAVQMLDRSAVPMNTLLSVRELLYIAQDAELTLVLTSTAFRELFEALDSQAPGLLRPLYLEEMEDRFTPEEKSALCAEPPQASADSTAVIMYTSGTTGLAKGVMLTHRNLVSNAEGTAQALSVSREDICYCVLPLFHSFALTMLSAHLFRGARAVVESRFSPSAAMHALEKHQASFVFLTPAHWNLLLRSGHMTSESCAAIRVALSGGGPLPVSLQRAWREKTRCELLNGYGLTEASPVVSTNRPEAWREQSIGLLLPDVRGEICDEQGRRLAPGQIGELVVSGPNVMRGYLNKATETAEVLSSEGWLRTGDLGYIDPEGYVFLTGRKKELIIFAGENVMPQEIEHALGEHPAVAEVAVVGVHDEKKGEYPKAFLVLREGAAVTEGELREWLRTRLAAFKIPRAFEVLERLPKNAMGKVQKHLLRG